ncbi:MAG: metal ABC transporter permease [Helicobacter sp.]|nr:metal ABC transporter permease [Helicobacter sp.]
MRIIWSGLLFSALEYAFMQNALLGAVFISIICGVIGSLVVSNKMVFIAGGIAHSVYGGVGIAAFFGISIMLGAASFSVLCALALAYMLLYAKERLDSIIGSLWAFGMALGIILVELTPGYSKDFMGYLFGSILSVTAFDLWIMSIFALFLVMFVVANYRLILGFSYDSEFARLKGIPINILSIMLMLLIALGVVISMQSVGIILIVALLSIPAYCALVLTKSLGMMMILSSIISFVSMLCGLYFAYNFDLQAGASIVLSLTLLSFMLSGFYYFRTYAFKSY